ncbi:SAM-dependent methyltransferase [Pelagicoccus albus]|uniref:Class I SAM-dependent methyltransferase n=1 Tax=Pelagicoccus albus TaxID=415222 RepID=A0A7X1B965_9BACT|nr:cyclopropane-fatty-acyl-phospholipid synthase family protein [Pelagicoccus albus]MBC2607991.1 class I SAM-dependent methyltransferase [Pelagicoccus albus]
MNTLKLAENGYIPYFLLRFGIRQRLKRKLEIEASKGPDSNESFKRALKQSALAVDTDKANEQHYEVPAEFFELVLGPYLKYSSGYWPEGCNSIEESELASLELVAERAQLKDGQDILELGCGWGSFSLWAAAKFPYSQITTVSNSSSQAEFIRKRASERGLTNLNVVTCDINAFDTPLQFDRIVSIEMLEHVRNYDALFAKLSNWLRDDAKMFVHVFSHKKHAYAYDASNPSEWMARHFFTGGIMPSHDLLPSFDKYIQAEESWALSGVHYQKTSEAWLQNMNTYESKIEPIFAKVYGPENAKQWMWRWRLFFLACAELFGYKNGSEWGVSHYRFTKQLSK